jgi:hypothetical protein
VAAKKALVEVEREIKKKKAEEPRTERALREFESAYKKINVIRKKNTHSKRVKKG